MSLQLTAEQQSPRSEAGARRRLRLQQGPARCKPAPTAARAGGPALPLRAPQTLAAPRVESGGGQEAARPPRPRPRAPLFANSAHMGGRGGGRGPSPRRHRAPASSGQRRPAGRLSSRHLHPGCRGRCPCSEPSNGLGSAAAVAVLAAAAPLRAPAAPGCTAHTPRRFWRDAALISSPAAPPPPGAARGWLLPGGCHRAPGLRPPPRAALCLPLRGAGTALAPGARGGVAPHGGICRPPTDVSVRAGF